MFQLNAEIILCFTVCVGDTYHCSNKKTCIPNSYCCDGIFDCNDKDFRRAEDEQNCDCN